MKQKRKALLGLMAVLALVVSSFFTFQASAAQPLCWQCIYIWFNGTFCDWDGHLSNECIDTAAGCRLIGDDCDSLTKITQ